MESHILVQKPNDYDYLKDWLGEGLLTRYVDDIILLTLHYYLAQIQNGKHEEKC